MSEYFITARSFAAPFCSDTSEKYVEADSPRAALEAFASDYSHPCGLYAAECWSSADAFHKREKALAVWESNDLQAEKRATMNKGAFSRERRADGLYIDDVRVVVHGDPRQGSVV